MIRKLAYVATLALVVGPASYLVWASLTSSAAKAEGAQQTTQTGDKEGEKAKDSSADKGEGKDAQKEEENKKTDKYLGVDWGDNKEADKDKTKKENPDEAQPANKVDLGTALEPAQAKRLEKIKADVARAETVVKKADEAYSGKDEKVKKIDAIKLFESAAVIYHRAYTDVTALAKGIKDDDIRLTLLREYGDLYKRKACEMFCRAATTCVETAGNDVNALKMAVSYLKRARQIDPTYPGIEEGLAAVRTAFADLQARLAQTKSTSTGGGGKDKEETKPYDDGRQTHDPAETGREDYKRIGR
jgi:hypothetical protein